MPFEPTYGFPYEAPSDIPGWSLTGGPDGSQPILAEAFAVQLRRIDDQLSTLIDSFGFYPTAIQAGTASVTTSTSVVSGFYNANYFRGSAAVVFATPFTTTTPAVMVTANSTVPGTVIEASASSVTINGCTVNVAHQNNTTLTLMWVASALTQT
jgi:hypothetical protein